MLGFEPIQHKENDVVVTADALKKSVQNSFIIIINGDFD